MEGKKIDKIAVIRIKGQANLRKEVRNTLQMLNISKKNNCVIIKGTPSNLGMIKKVKDFITWGEVSGEVEKLMDKRKHGRYFKLHPPRGGFGRKGIKVPFKLSGGLGYRGDKINDLLKRMV